MNRINKKFLICLPFIFSLLFLSHCGSGSGPDTKFLALLYLTTPIDYTIGESSLSMDLTQDYNVQEYIFSHPGGVNINFTLSLDTYYKNVYFIFTNTSTTSDASNPVIQNMNQISAPADTPASSIEQQSNVVASGDNYLRGTTEIIEFNHNSLSYINSMNPISTLLNLFSIPEPRYADIPNVSTKNFIITESGTTVAATCRQVVSDIEVSIGGVTKTKTLNVWVANNCWIDGGSTTQRVNQIMVDAVTNKFLLTGLDNDIYDWVTGIYGEEWGTPSYGASYLIDEATSDNEITILLYDINSYFISSGTILGYFWAKDNYKKSAIPFSNERIMFYLDAITLATNDGSWAITDTGPAYIISTLGHEFQHMIHFYQKNVQLTQLNGTDVWIDEMSSLVTEDLISSKIGIDGPRGVLYSDPTAGSSGNSAGRLPEYNYRNYYSVTTWNNSSANYSINYAFGAYLARNYGGAEFFHNVMHNKFTDYRAIEYAMSLSGAGGTFGDALQKWAAANLFSNIIITDSSSRYRYNSGTWFTNTYNSIEYNLGSINLFNYSYIPNIYTSISSGTMPAASNKYYLAGSSLTGTNIWNITLAGNVRLTVLLKDP